MKNNNSRGNHLPRMISGMWMLNIAGAAGLIAFFWLSSNSSPAIPMQDATTRTSEAATPFIDGDSTPIITTDLDIEITAAWGLPDLTTETPTSTPSPTPTPLPGSPSVIGYSVSGRPLEVYQFGTGPTARLIVAGIHGGNEWNTIKLAYELMDYIAENPEIIPENITLYVLPNLNPDGEARVHGLDGRVNDNGVDLNRNWPYRWEKDFDRTNCWKYRPVTAGESPASEPETKALLDFIVSHPEINGLISYHAAALGIFAGGVPDYKPSMRLAESIAKVSTYQYPPKDIGCTYTGNLTDWASSVQGIAAVDIELHNFKYTDFEENLKILKTFLKFKR